MSYLLFLCGTAGRHVCTTETNTYFGWTVLLHPPYNHDFHHQIWPAWLLRKKSVRTPLCQWEGTAEWHMQVAAEEGQDLLLEVNIRLLFKNGRMLTKETTWNGNYAFSNTVVKFCGIFTCIICKQHEIKNRGITFWLCLAYATRSKALWFLFRILCFRSWILYFFYVGGGGCGGIGGSSSNHAE